MLLAGAATAACGPIAFLGLVVPHVARLLCRRGLPLGGAVRRAAGRAAAGPLPTCSGRVVARPGEVQVGIVMALVGGPVFVVWSAARGWCGSDGLHDPHRSPAARRRRRGWCRCARSWPRSVGLGRAVRAGRRSTSRSGDFEIPVADVLRTLARRRRRRPAVHRHGAAAAADAVAVLVGAALGLAGALTQTFARNPLASPDILGVTEGAAVGAVAVIVLSGGQRLRRRPGLRLAAVDGAAASPRSLGGLLTADRALRAVLAARHRRPAAGPDRHRPQRVPRRGHLVAAGPGPDPGRRQRPGLAQRLAQRPRLGARHAAAVDPGRAGAGLAPPGAAPQRPPARRRRRPRASASGCRPPSCWSWSRPSGWRRSRSRPSARSTSWPSWSRRSPCASPAAPARRCSPRWSSAAASSSAPTWSPGCCSPSPSPPGWSRRRSARRT